ncbi:MAG TPA: hypothetical protein VND68_05815, partial [Chloroflexia bacterium]|nr:hypothetical protein [Chloroflexia bacterium]
VSLEPWLGNTLGETVRSFVTNLFTDQSIRSASVTPLHSPGTGGGAFISWDSRIPTSFLVTIWAHAIGLAALVAGLTLLVQQGLLAAWRAWSATEERELFVRPPNSTRDSVRPRRTFALLMLLIPTLAISFLIWKPFDTAATASHWLRGDIVQWITWIITLTVAVLSVGSAVAILRDRPIEPPMGGIDKEACPEQDSDIMHAVLKELVQEPDPAANKSVPEASRLI